MELCQLSGSSSLQPHGPQLFLSSYWLHSSNLSGTIPAFLQKHLFAFRALLCPIRTCRTTANCTAEEKSNPRVAHTADMLNQGQSPSSYRARSTDLHQCTLPCKCPSELQPSSTRSFTAFFRRLPPYRHISSRDYVTVRAPTLKSLTMAAILLVPGSTILAILVKVSLSKDICRLSPTHSSGRQSRVTTTHWRCCQDLCEDAATQRDRPWMLRRPSCNWVCMHSPTAC